MLHNKFAFYGTRERLFGARLMHLRNPHINPKLNKRSRRALGSQSTRIVLRETMGLLYVTHWPTEEYLTMPFKKHQMINVPLSTKELSEADKWIAEELLDPIDHLHTLLEAGYKVSTRYIDERKAFVFTVTGTDETPQNTSASMSTWSGELSDALALSTWKVAILFRFGAWIDRSSDNRRG